MSKHKKRTTRGQVERRLRVRSVRREPPDLKRLARALIELAQAQAETDALVQHERRQPKSDSTADDTEHGTRPGDAA